jgi:hypothetical protein
MPRDSFSIHASDNEGQIMPKSSFQKGPVTTCVDARFWSTFVPQNPQGWPAWTSLDSLRRCCVEHAQGPD